MNSTGFSIQIYADKSGNWEEAFPYNVIFDELLVAQEDLLPTEDGGLRPGVEGSGARVHSCQHLLLGGFGNPSHHLISGLRRRQTGWKSLMSLQSFINIDDQLFVFYSVKVGYFFVIKADGCICVSADG